MYRLNPQSGRTRVHKIREGIKQRRAIQTSSKKKQQLTAYDKVLGLQRGFMIEGMDLSEYKKYTQEKLNQEKFFYQGLTDENVNNLYTAYEKLLKKDDNTYNAREELREMKRKQRKNFRKKRKEVIDPYKQELIISLFNELGKVSGKGVIKSTSHLSTDPNRWKETKNFLFSGGNYIEDSDKKWTSIYGKLTEINSHSLFDIAFYGSDDLKESYKKAS